MDETVTLRTLLIVGVPIAALLLITLLALLAGGGMQAAWRRLLGASSDLERIERRQAELEAALADVTGPELPIAIEAERLAEEIEQIAAERRSSQASQRGDPQAIDRPMEETGGSASERDDGTVQLAVTSSPLNEDSDDDSEANIDAEPLIDLPPDPDESEEDRIAREELETEERERIERLAAEEARVRAEREAAEHAKRQRVAAEAKRRREEKEERDRIERERRAEASRIENERRAKAERIERERREEAERIENERREKAEREERERLEAEAARKLEAEQLRKAEEFRRRVADATPKIVMSAGGSNREAVTVNVAVTNNITPKRAEIAVLSSSWAQEPAPARFDDQRKDGLYEEHWPKSPRSGAKSEWGTYSDSMDRSFDCPSDPPTEDHAWIVISYERIAGGPASTWQRFEVGGAGALWYVRQAIGDPIVVEANRLNEAAA